MVKNIDNINYSDSWWTGQYDSEIKTICRTEFIANNSLFNWSMTIRQNMILRAIETDNTVFLNLILDIFRVPEENLTLKQRLSLYNLTGAYKQGLEYEQ